MTFFPKEFASSTQLWTQPVSKFTLKDFLQTLHGSDNDDHDEDNEDGGVNEDDDDDDDDAYLELLNRWEISHMNCANL